MNTSASNVLAIQCMQVNNIIDAYVIDRVFTPGARVRKGTNAYSDIHPHELVASCFRSIFSMGALMVAVKLNSGCTSFICISSHRRKLI
jgi:hypothetical protein